jgi:hypothetical protein
MLGLGNWYERADMAPWWLLKATGAAWAGLEGRDARGPDFEMGCKQMQCLCSAEAPEGGRCLTIESTTIQRQSSQA